MPWSCRLPVSCGPSAAASCKSSLLMGSKCQLWVLDHYGLGVCVGPKLQGSGVGTIQGCCACFVCCCNHTHSLSSGILGSLPSTLLTTGLPVTFSSQRSPQSRWQSL